MVIFEGSTRVRDANIISATVCSGFNAKTRGSCTTFRYRSSDVGCERLCENSDAEQE